MLLENAGPRASGAGYADRQRFSEVEGAQPCAPSKNEKLRASGTELGSRPRFSEVEGGTALRTFEE